jgi:hypothetical protein
MREPESLGQGLSRSGEMSYTTRFTSLFLFPTPSTLFTPLGFPFSHAPSPYPIFPISMGAPVMVELEGETDPLKIAMKELK